MGSSKGSAPAAPDYTGAAEATAAGNRTNQVTPYGNLTYNQTGTDAQGHPTYTATTELTPQLQQLLGINQQTQAGLGNLASGSVLGQAQQNLGQGFDTSKLPQAPINPGQTAQQAIMSRLQPQFDRDQSRLENQLLNQGLQRGSAAYKNAETQFGQNKNDAYQQAALQGINLDTQARQGSLQEQSYLRDLPLNELSALQQGSQVQMPQFQDTAPGPDYLGALNAQYTNQINANNAKQSGSNALTSGLFGLGSSAIGGFFSDRRLKSNIVQVGSDPRGFGLYEYDIFGRRERGVMAQEVQKIIPHAVHRHESGYLMVNYGAL